mmetsp:Transcript_53594/g.120851  ORF Transcript_53594/g.120851 Transcript_53594/m.120851 type:complete len:413 (-) Transcript_53594:62-1300(-)
MEEVLDYCARTSHVALGIQVSSLVSALIAVGLTFYNLYQHMRHNCHPLLQRYTVRILLMVPLYSSTSCLELWVPVLTVRIWSEVVRHIYETVVIFSFLQFILVCAGGPKALVLKFVNPGRARPSEQSSEVDSSDEDSSDAEGRGDSEPSGTEDEVAANSNRLGITGVLTIVNQENSGMSTPQPPKHLRPIRHLPFLGWFLPPWRSATQMLKACVWGTLGYIITGGLYGSSIGVLLIWSWLDDFSVDPADELPCLTWFVRFLMVVFQGMALTALTTLGINMMEELKPIHCERKFLSVKLVIFFTFWQGLLLKILESVGVLDSLAEKEVKWSTPKEVSSAIQNLLICIEMMVASVLHLWVWPPVDSLIIVASLEMQIHSERAEPPSNPGAAVVDLRDIVGLWRNVRRLTSNFGS